MKAQIGLRQARNFLVVAEYQCLTRAANVLKRSQTAVTKTIQDLEKQIGLTLFVRSSRGVRLTPYGAALIPRLREAAAAFKQGEQLVAVRSLNQSAGIARFFSMDVSDNWIDAFISVAERGSLSSAASHLKRSTVAVSSSIRKIEDTLCLSLFERTLTGLAPTALGRALLENVKLARSHLQSAGDDVFSLQGVRRGKVRVGTLPFMQTMILPRATLRLLKDHPQLDVVTRELLYDDLVAALKCGDIDFFVGSLRGASVDPALSEERLLEDHISLMVRKGHELETKERIEWTDLLRYQWILPMHGTRTREVLAQALNRSGIALPDHFIESSSIPMLRGVLLESDRIAISSRHQFYIEEKHGLLTVLPFDLHETPRSIGITRRVHGAPAPGPELLIQKIKEVVGELGPLISSTGRSLIPVDGGVGRPQNLFPEDSDGKRFEDKAVTAREVRRAVGLVVVHGADSRNKRKDST